MSASSVIELFARQHVGTKLALRETLSRDAIVVQGRRRTLGYVNVGKELWGEMLVLRFNAHEDLVQLARQYAGECGECAGTGVKPDDEPCDECKFIRDVLAKAEGRT